MCVCGGVSGEGEWVCDCVYCACIHMQQIQCNTRNSMSAQASMNSMVLWETSKISAQAGGLLFVFHLQRKTSSAPNQN